MIDEYKVANPFIEVGFRQVKDVVDLRVFDLLNISRINNNRAEEMLLCIYHLLQPDRRIDEGIYNDEIDQYFSYREWKKKHQPLSGVTVREILTTEDLNEVALLRIFDGVTAAFYKSDEYNSREYRYSNLSELRKAMKHKEGPVRTMPFLFGKKQTSPFMKRQPTQVLAQISYESCPTERIASLSCGTAQSGSSKGKSSMSFWKEPIQSNNQRCDSQNRIVVPNGGYRYPKAKRK